MTDVPTNTPPESSEEEFSNSEASYSSEEDEPSDSENTNESIVVQYDTKYEFWTRYPVLNAFLCKMALFLGNGIVTEYYVLEKVKLMGHEKAKELNDKCEAFRIQDLESRRLMSSFISDLVSLLKP